MIENGKLTAPVKGATIIGNGPDVLTRVSMVGNNMELDSGIGVCGKDGQSVPVGVGQPSIRIDDLTVGGTYRWGLLDDDGDTMVATGRFLEIDAPTRLVQTWSWEHTLM